MVAVGGMVVVLLVLLLSSALSQVPLIERYRLTASPELTCAAYANSSACIGAPADQKCFWCALNNPPCLHAGELNCSSLSTFYPPALCNSMICPTSLASNSPYYVYFQYPPLAGWYVGFIAASVVTPLFMLLGFIFLICMCRNTAHFFGRLWWDAEIKGEELKFYAKFVEWTLLVIAFSSALNLFTRPSNCVWSYKAPCLNRLTDSSLLDESCGSVTLKCCDIISRNLVSSDLYAYCTCHLAQGTCLRSEVICETTWALMLVLSISLATLIATFFLSKSLKIMTFPFYLGAVNFVFYMWTYGIPQCGDQEMVNQYFVNAILLGAAFVCYCIMIPLFIFYDYGGEDVGVTKHQDTLRTRTGKRASVANVNKTKPNPGFQTSSQDVEMVTGHLNI